MKATIMATTDYEREIQRPLAEIAYKLKQKYKVTHGMGKKQFLALYDEGEIALSTVFENLTVVVRNHHSKPTTKVSENARDFSNNGDKKIGVLKKNGDQRRYVISNVENKIGMIYFTGWNWMTNQPNFFAIPRPTGGFPKCGIKIMVCPYTGTRTGGKYNLHAYDSFEEMALIG
jgi:hypothetical protein